MNPRHTRCRRPRGCHDARHSAAFSLIEAVMAMLIVSIMFTAALNTLSGARLAQERVAERSRGLQLAQAKLTEIMALPYEEPVQAVMFGPESGEGTPRFPFDDVDDFHNWSESPVRDRQGQVVPGLENGRRTVTVTFVDPDNQLAVSSTETGVKCVTVTVWRDQRQIATAVALKTRASD